METSLSTYSKKRMLMLITLVVVIFLTFYSLWAMRFQRPHYTVALPVTGGVWDLREFDFSAGNALIEGDVEFIPFQLLTPQEFALKESEIVIGEAFENDYSTSRIRLLLPDGIYACSFRSIDFAQRTYINGFWVSDIGLPGSSAETVVPRTAELYYTFQTQDGVVEIIQQGSNFVHKEGSNHDKLLIGLPESLSWLRARELFVVQFYMGCFMALLIIHAALYYISSNVLSNIFCALFCAVWLIRTGTTGPKVWSSVFPQLSWYISIKSEYISLPLSMIFLLLVIHDRFPGLVQKGFLYGTLSLSSGYCVFCLLTDTITMSRSLPAYYAVLIIVIIYIIVRFICSLRSILPEQLVLLVAIIILMYSVVVDVLYYSGIRFLFFTYMPIMDSTALIFVFFQMISMLYATMRDVEQSRALKQELIAENAVLERVNHIKNEFLGNISHELRTPLTIISTHAQLTKSRELMRDEPNDYVVDKMLMIVSEVEHLSEMVEQLLDVSKLEEDGITLVLAMEDIRSLIENVTGFFSPLALKSDNRLIIKIAPNLPPTLCDGRRIRQVILNLITNSVRFTRHGTITVEAELGGDCIIIAVTDTGTGIREDVLPYIFDRYYSASSAVGETATGTGIGLFLAKYIIEQHGGKIWANSIYGEGTTISFTLPISTD